MAQVSPSQPCAQTHCPVRTEHEPCELQLGSHFDASACSVGVDGGDKHEGTVEKSCDVI